MEGGELVGSGGGDCSGSVGGSIDDNCTGGNEGVQTLSVFFYRSTQCSVMAV